MLIEIGGNTLWAIFWVALALYEGWKRWLEYRIKRLEHQAPLPLKRLESTQRWFDGPHYWAGGPNERCAYTEPQFHWV